MVGERIVRVVAISPRNGGGGKPVALHLPPVRIQHQQTKGAVFLLLSFPPPPPPRSFQPNQPRFRPLHHPPKQRPPLLASPPCTRRPRLRPRCRRRLSAAKVRRPAANLRLTVTATTKKKKEGRNSVGKQHFLLPKNEEKSGLGRGFGMTQVRILRSFECAFSSPF